MIPSFYANSSPIIPPEVTSKVGEFLTPHEIAMFARVNRQCSYQARRLFVDFAKKLGFECSDSDAVKKSIQKLLKENQISSEFLQSSDIYRFFSKREMYATATYSTVKKYFLQMRTKKPCDPTAWKEGGEALYVAIEKVDREAVQILLEHHADPTYITGVDYTIHHAVKTGSKEIITLLIKKDVSLLNTLNKNGVTALFWACQDKNIEMVKYLLSLGADPHISTKKGWYSIHAAAQQGQYEIVKLLLENGAQVDVMGPEEVTPLFIACQDYEYAEFRHYYETVECLLQKGANPNGTPRARPLLIAASKGFIDRVSILLHYKADINIRGKLEETALHAAAKSSKYQHMGVIFLLFQRGIDMNILNKEGKSALDIALTANWIETAIQFFRVMGAKTASEIKTLKETQVTKILPKDATSFLPFNDL